MPLPQRVAEARRELIWRKSANDPVYWAESFWMIRHPKGRRLLELRQPQREALNNFADGGNWLTLKARQIGWSTITTTYAFWKAYLHDDQRILLISKGEREARELLEMIKFGMERLPEWVRARGPKVVAATLESLKFSNGSEINSLPSASNPGRGFSGSLVVVDEWAHLPNDEDAWASIEPVADIGGQIIGLSTANGVGNWFHREWEKAVRKENSFRTMFYSWRAVPERDDEWYARKQRDMLPWQLHQEYPTTAEEAFLKSGNPVFDLENLKKFGDGYEPSIRGYLFAKAIKAHELREQPNGALRVWKLPEEGHVYVIGADVAEGLEHGDASSAHVIDVKTAEMVAHWHGRTDPDLFGEELFALGIFYYGALLGVEANNHGISVTSTLKRMNYPRLWRRREVGSTTANISTRYGFLTNKETKPLMIDDLARCLRLDLHIPCGDTLREIRSYTRDEKGKMSGSPFDDRVMSLGIANHMRQFAFAPEYAHTVSNHGTLDWWASQQEAPPPSTAIGNHNIRQPLRLGR